MHVANARESHSSQQPQTLTKFRKYHHPEVIGANFSLRTTRFIDNYLKFSRIQNHDDLFRRIQ